MTPCSECGLAHIGSCLEALKLEVSRLRNIIVETNNILFEACRHADDVEHTIECHPETINDQFRAVAKGVSEAMDIVGAEVLTMFGG